MKNNKNLNPLNDPEVAKNAYNVSRRPAVEFFG